MMINAEFRVLNGVIVEKKSGKGIPNLLVKAWLKESHTELEPAISSEDGCFQLCCPVKETAELSLSSLVVSVIAPPYRRLTNLQTEVSWNGKCDPLVKVELSSDELGWLSPERPGDRVETGISISSKDFTVEKRGNYSYPKLRNASTGGPQGSPALPALKHYVVFSRKMSIATVEVTHGKGEIFPGVSNPFPAQVFGSNDAGSIPNHASHVTRLDKKCSSRLFPEKLIHVVGEKIVGQVKIAELQIHPVQYSPKASGYILYRKLKYSVSFTAGKMKKSMPEDDPERIVSNRIDFLQSFTEKDNVLICRNLFWDWGDILIRRWPNIPYVIITDNHSWPESVDVAGGGTRAPGMAERGAALDGDLVKEFNSLARWRTSLGMYSRVIRISSIVNGNFGDFTEAGFARDLQEVIRNFLKFALNEWGTEYVLLGGDFNVVPIRALVGRSQSRLSGCSRDTANPPAEMYFFCQESSAGKVLKMHPAFDPEEGDCITNMRGNVIPYNPSGGNGQKGWYYTSDDSFNDTSISTGFENTGIRTRKIIVEGFDDSFVLEDNGSPRSFLMWIRWRNQIPSDFYYSSLVGTHYSRPCIHDFDSSGNGFYGEYDITHHSSTDTWCTDFIDSISTTPDMWVGRGSVESGDEARAFIRKVIQYERLYIPMTDIRDLQSPFGEGMPAGSTEWVHRDAEVKNYLKKALFGQSNMDLSPPPFQFITQSVPPGEGEYNCIDTATGLPCTSATTSCEYRIHLQFDIALGDSVPDRYCMWEFVSFVNGLQDAFVVQYDQNCSGSEAGWCFTTDDSYSVVSSLPTRFVRISGCSCVDESTGYTRFKWNKTWDDFFVVSKEEVRLLMEELFPHVTDVERHYEDVLSYPPPPAIVPLSEYGIRSSINRGPHFLSLIGHGSMRGCCEIDIFDDPVFTNSDRYFIAFVDACSTGLLDNDTYDSFAEHSTIYPNGGAVGYVGNTRHGSSSTGTKYEKAFWSDLAQHRILGIAANLGAELGTDLWYRYTQHLFGDPAMKVWTRIPLILRVSHPRAVQVGDVITVEGSITLRSRLSNAPRVTLLGGWHDDGRRPDLFVTKEVTLVDQGSSGPPTFAPTFHGVVCFDVPMRCPDRLTLTVHGENLVPYVTRIEVRR